MFVNRLPIVAAAVAAIVCFFAEAHAQTAGYYYPDSRYYSGQGYAPQVYAQQQQPDPYADQDQYYQQYPGQVYYNNTDRPAIIVIQPQGQYYQPAPGYYAPQQAPAPQAPAPQQQWQYQQQPYQGYNYYQQGPSDNDNAYRSKGYEGYYDY